MALIRPSVPGVRNERCAVSPFARYSMPASSLLAGPDPMQGIDCLVTRRLEPRPDAPVLNPAERVSVLQAIRMYTYNGAYSSFEEHLKGSLEVGKLADLALLSEDILRLNAEEIRHVRAIMTILNGKVVCRA